MYRHEPNEWSREKTIEERVVVFGASKIETGKGFSRSQITSLVGPSPPTEWKFKFPGQSGSGQIGNNVKSSKKSKNYNDSPNLHARRSLKQQAKP